jgi:hypothetical protein
MCVFKFLRRETQLCRTRDRARLIRLMLASIGRAAPIGRIEVEGARLRIGQLLISTRWSIRNGVARFPSRRRGGTDLQDYSLVDSLA